jgi:hypothetical protein
MSLNLTNTINFASPYVQYGPLNAGLGQEPAISIASMIRNSILAPPQTHYWNRASTTFSTVVSQQDYTATISDLGYIEKATLLDDQGNYWEIKDVYNHAALSPSGGPLVPNGPNQRPSAISLESYNGVGGTATFRLLGVPDQIYTVTVTYQKASPQFGPFFITSVAAAVGPNTTYTGTFDPLSFPTSANATIFGCTNAANNGTFVVVSCSATSLVVANASGVLEAGPDTTAFAANLSWAPIPDWYSDVYNNLFLAEAISYFDADAQRSQQYRQRGVAAFLSKTQGLTDMQRNAFMQQWLVRSTEQQFVMGQEQLGHQGRGI